MNHVMYKGCVRATINGCYDGIHPGHLFFFGYVKGKVDRLIVGINSDDYIRRTKNREPHYLLEQRIDILHNTGLFNEILPFDDDTPNEFIRYINPNYHYTGEEYAPNPVEKMICDEMGIGLRFVPRIPNLSSSKLDKKFLRKFNKLFL